jgi:hypothetical protein
MLNELFRIRLHDFFLVRISVADPGSLSRIPYPTFFHPGSELSPSRIPDLTNGFGFPTLVMFLIGSCFCSIMDKRGLVVDFYVASKSMVSYSANMGKNQ